MIDFTFDRKTTDSRRGSRHAAVVDVAGAVWGHSNPAELYRWISRRNALLETIAVAFPHAARRPASG